MNLSRILQTLLVRDMFSYFVPGLIALAGPLVLSGRARGAVSTAASWANSTLGGKIAAIAAAGVVYGTGFLAATVAWLILEKVLNGKWPVKIEPWRAALLTERLGPKASSATADDLVQAVEQELQVARPRTFDMNIERLWQIRNFELGLFGAGLAWLSFAVLEARWLAVMTCGAATVLVGYAWREDLKVERCMATAAILAGIIPRDAPGDSEGMD
jgi:mannitol-specific phosphotransferase system IIBC component